MTFNHRPFLIKTCLLILFVACGFAISVRYTKADDGWLTGDIADNLTTSGSGYCESAGPDWSETAPWTYSDDSTKYLTDVWYGLPYNVNFQSWGYDGLWTESVTGINDGYTYASISERAHNDGGTTGFLNTTCNCGDNSCGGSRSISPTEIWGRLPQATYPVQHAAPYTMSATVEAVSKAAGGPRYYSAVGTFGVEWEQCNPGGININANCQVVTGTISVDSTIPASPVITWTSNSNPVNGVQIIRTGTSGNTWNETTTNGSLTDSLTPGTYTYTLYGYDGFNTKYELSNNSGQLDTITITVPTPAASLNASWQDNNQNSETMTASPNSTVQPNFNFSNTGPAASKITNIQCLRTSVTGIPAQDVTIYGCASSTLSGSGGN